MRNAIENMNIEDELNKCYWCNQPATSIEHVPPKNLFPKGYRDELITVKSCDLHNQDFSKIDERIRFHMTSMGGESEIAKKHFDDKTIRVLLRHESKGLATDLVQNRFTTPEGELLSKESAIVWDLYFEKIIRALYFTCFKKPLDGNTHFFSNKIAMLSLSANAHFYYHLLENKLSDFWIEGNPKNKQIFDYKYYYSETENQFFTIMKFYEHHKVIGISFPVNKKINDYSLSFEEYKKNLKKMKRK